MADFLGLMKQAAQLQSKMQALQAELDLIEVEGSAGGGMVSVRMTAKGDLKGVTIDESLYKPSDKEIVEDLLVAAHADAKRKAEGVMQEKMKGLTGGLPLPPGLGLGWGVYGKHCRDDPPPCPSPTRGEGTMEARPVQNLCT